MNTNLFPCFVFPEQAKILFFGYVQLRCHPVHKIQTLGVFLCTNNCILVVRTSYINKAKITSWEGQIWYLDFVHILRQHSDFALMEKKTDLNLWNDLKHFSYIVLIIARVAGFKGLFWRKKIMKSVNKIWPRLSNSTTKTDSPQALKAWFFSNEREKKTHAKEVSKLLL